MLDLVLPPLAEIHSPIREWLKDCTDSWLVNYLSDTVWASEQCRSAWLEAVAVGLFARMQEIRDDEVPAVWARTLSDEQVATLVSHARATFDGVVELLSDIKSQTDVGSAGWLQDVAWLFEKRDNIESVRWVLAQSGRAEPLQRLFETMDRWIGQCLASIPTSVVIKDERLSRVATKSGLPATIGSIRFEAA
jgi:hypothetical protein